MLLKTQRNQITQLLLDCGLPVREFKFEMPEGVIKLDHPESGFFFHMHLGEVRTDRGIQPVFNVVFLPDKKDKNQLIQQKKGVLLTL